MRLTLALQNNGYLGLNDSYEHHDITDMSSVCTSYSPPGSKTKSVMHYVGDQSAPRELREVEEGIDRIIHIEQWIGTRDERMKTRDD